MTIHPPRDRPQPSVQDIFDRDAHPAPAILRFESPAQDQGTQDIPIDRYFSREWHDREMDKVWRKVWQMACRLEEIPEVGDHIIYEIGDESLIVVRTEDGVKAHVNACLHRGVLLRTAGGCVERFKCPFHGFTWDLEGRLRQVPSAWDFAHIDQSNFNLPQAHVGIWGGFVFINLAKDPEPFESYLEILPAHFERFKLEERWKAVHVAKILPCNWKLAQEAFIESFHIPVAHPQTTAYVAWDTTQYDVFPGVRHVDRMITVEAVPSTSQGEVEAAETIRQMQRDVAFHAGWDVTLEDAQTIRQVFGDRARAKLTKSAKRDMSDQSDAEVLDVIQYSLFPNLVPWGGHGAPICYRFRPYKNDPEQSVMEVMLLLATAQDGSHPKPPPTIWLGPDDRWEDAKVLGSAGFVADQDTENLRRIQKGLRASHKPGITLAQYQESRIRHFHNTLDHYMEQPE